MGNDKWKILAWVGVGIIIGGIFAYICVVDAAHNTENKLEELHEYYNVVLAYADKTGDYKLWNLAHELHHLDLDAKVVNHIPRNALLYPSILGIILIIIGAVLHKVKRT